MEKDIKKDLSDKIVSSDSKEKGILKKVKYIDQYNFYKEYKLEKTTYKNFANRIILLNMSYDKAIKKEIYIGGYRIYKTHVDDKGRVCTKCLDYKIRDMFYNTKQSKSGKTHICKECQKLYMKEYYQT